MAEIVAVASPSIILAHHVATHVVSYEDGNAVALSAAVLVAADMEALVQPAFYIPKRRTRYETETWVTSDLRIWTTRLTGRTPSKIVSSVE